MKKSGVATLKNTHLSFYDVYSAEAAHNRYEAKQKSKQGYLKINKNIVLANFIEEQIIKNKLSPYAALELAEKNGFTVNFCLKTLYNYIFNGLFLNLKTSYFPYYSKKRKYRKISKSVRKIARRSIEEMEENINNRDELDH